MGSMLKGSIYTVDSVLGAHKVLPEYTMLLRDKMKDFNLLSMFYTALKDYTQGFWQGCKIKNVAFIDKMSGNPIDWDKPTRPDESIGSGIIFRLSDVINYNNKDVQSIQIDKVEIKNKIYEGEMKNDDWLCLHDKRQDILLNTLIEESGNDLTTYSFEGEKMREIINRPRFRELHRIFSNNEISGSKKYVVNDLFVFGHCHDPDGTKRHYINEHGYRQDQDASDDNPYEKFPEYFEGENKDRRQLFDLANVLISKQDEFYDKTQIVDIPEEKMSLITLEGKVNIGVNGEMVENDMTYMFIEYITNSKDKEHYDRMGYMISVKEDEKGVDFGRIFAKIRLNLGHQMARLQKGYGKDPISINIMLSKESKLFKNKIPKYVIEEQKKQEVEEKKKKDWTYFRPY